MRCCEVAVAKNGNILAIKPKGEVTGSLKSGSTVGAKWLKRIQRQGRKEEMELIMAMVRHAWNVRLTLRRLPGSGSVHRSTAIAGAQARRS